MMTGYRSGFMSFDGLCGPVIPAVTCWLNSRLVHVLGHILGRIFLKLDMMNGHRSVTIPFDGRHGPLITAVTVG